ncbi:MAG TPA: phosphotransferase [Micromonosporaceae bacterium]|jgi:Ser/Thr protein kinase RdoA (MazF antagonist)
MSTVLRSLARPDALADLLERDWGLSIERVVLHRSLANDVYRVDPDHFLKIYRHDWRTPEEVAWECELIEHLVGRGIPVAPVTPRLDGTLSGVWHAPEGPRPLVLMERIDGRRPKAPFSPGLHRAHGRLVARIHTAGDTFRSAHRRRPRDLATTLDEPLAQVLPLLSRDDRAMAVRLAEAARTGLAHSAPTRGICHGDATMDNVVIIGGTEADPQIATYDFDLAGEGYLAADFPFSAKNWGQFLAGYTEVRAVTPADLVAQPWLDIIDVIEDLRFHLVVKPAWRGTESTDESFLDETLGDLREMAAKNLEVPA